MSPDFKYTNEFDSFFSISYDHVILPFPFAFIHICTRRLEREKEERVLFFSGIKYIRLFSLFLHFSSSSRSHSLLVSFFASSIVQQRNDFTHTHTHQDIFFHFLFCSVAYSNLLIIERAWDKIKKKRKKEEINLSNFVTPLTLLFSTSRHRHTCLT